MLIRGAVLWVSFLGAVLALDLSTFKFGNLGLYGLTINVTYNVFETPAKSNMDTFYYSTMQTVTVDNSLTKEISLVVKANYFLLENVFITQYIKLPATQCYLFTGTLYLPYFKDIGCDAYSYLETLKILRPA